MNKRLFKGFSLIMILAMMFAAVPTQSAEAAGTISLTTLGSPYTENFDTLSNTAGSTTNNLTIDGWSLTESGGGARDNEQYAVDTGGSGTGDMYSYGAAANTERALGGLRSGTLIPIFGASFTNNTGSTVTSLDIAYIGEEWRLGTAGRTDQINFEYSTNATDLVTGTWTGVASLNFVTPDTATAGAKNGNSAGDRTGVSGTISGLSIANGVTFWIRWTDTDSSGADDGLTVDDFSLTPFSAPPNQPVIANCDGPLTTAEGTPAPANISASDADGTVVNFSITSITPPLASGTISLSGLLPAGGVGGTATAVVNVDGAIPAGSYAVLITATNNDAIPQTGTCTLNVTVNAAPVTPGNVVISQVYGGGGNAGATFKNDFIELYNRTGSTISLSGWSVQYAAAAGTTWQVTSLTGSIAPGEYYLVQEAAGAGGTTSLPAPDATGTIAMSATSAKVALVNITTALTGACPTGPNMSDFVGYGSAATCSETAPTANLSNTTAALRIADVMFGLQDTNNNSDDFNVGAPNPRSRTPSVVSTTPLNGVFGILLDTNITINFSKPMDVAGNWFTISCASTGSHTAAVSGGPQSFVLDPDVDFAYNELCTVTIVANQVSDQDTNDPPDHLTADYVFSFTTFELLACGSADTLIHQIQGSGAQSPLANGTIVTIEGVVVGDYQGSDQFGGFHIQEEDADADADPTTSEGIFVFNSSFPVSVGDKVTVKGSVFEFFSSGTPLTELTSVRGGGLCNSGNNVTPATVTLPVSSVSDWERYEGMLINISQDLTATETFNLGRFGEVSLSANGRLRNPTNIVAPGAPAIAQQDLNNRSVFVLDDGNNQQNIDPTNHPTGGLSATNTLRSGYTVHGLTGVLEQRFGVYRVQPVGPISFDVTTNPRSATPEAVGGSLKVAALNVLNFFTTLDTASGLCGPTGGLDCRGANSTFEFNRQRDKMINAILAINPDIAGLMEVQNDSSATIQNVVDGLNDEAGAGTYTFINTGTIGTDAIKVAIIYKPATVTPIGPYAILDSSVDPLFIDTKNRPTLAQTFMSNTTGAEFTVVVNHLKSKGSDCNDIGDPDTGDGQGNCNVTRTKAATALVNWLATDPTGSGDPDFLVVGDMNSYAQEDPITTIKNDGYTNLLETLIGADAYSYVFDGQSGYLDHALASSSLTSQVTGVTEWHNNADEPTVLDYNVEFKTANQINTFYTSEPYRASDHDPVVVGLNLDPPPSVDFFLHGTGPTNNPPTLFLDNASPTAATEKYRDSASVKFSGGNLWKEIGTWPAAPALSPGILFTLSDAHAWLGLKNSDDQGTNFDLRIEVYKNGTLVASGESYCITGVTRNPSLAKEVTLSFGSFPPATFNGTTDVLSLKILTRIGTNGNGSFCGGHSNAVGLRLYFDAVSRPSRFDATFGP